MRKVLISLFCFCNLFSKSVFIEDIKSYYQKENLYLIGGGIALAGIIANSPLDQTLFDSFQSHCKSDPLDTALTIPRLIGGPESIYFYTGAAALSFAARGTYYGAFADTLFRRSFRAFIVGSLPLHAVRTLVGGRRPKCTSRSSYWKPFTKPHGASGDTYTGAILFLTWANMVENKPLKTFLYGASLLSGVGRIHDHYHYPSQVLLGWTMAFVACNAVSHTDSRLNLSASPDSVVIGFEF